jgi:3-hydroxyacyl-CoA dehydrogenase
MFKQRDSSIKEMKMQIKRTAVLGAGVMGATIAAHLANAGLDVLLLDIVPKELNDAEAGKGLTLESPAVRNRFAANGLAGAIKAKGLYHKDYAKQITVGNFDDDMAKIADCDWVVEVVVENDHPLDQYQRSVSQCDGCPAARAAS